MTAWRTPIVRQAENTNDSGKHHGTGSQPESAAAIRAERSDRPRSFAGAIMRLFRAAQKAITGQAPAPQPPTRRRRTEDTGSAAVQMAARKMWDTLDWLNQWHSDPLTHYDPASEIGADVHASPSNPLSLHL